MTVNPRWWAPRPKWCICDPAFYERRLLDPQCRHDEFEEFEEQLDLLRARAIRAEADADQLAYLMYVAPPGTFDRAFARRCRLALNAHESAVTTRTTPC